MSELLQEFVNSGSQRLRVDRDAGVIRGVKLLGLSSRNGRRYREAALVEAIGLYEGAKVNINHPKGHPLSPRDYQDRLGVVRGVQFRTGEGLFGDLHFNPRHALSEQLVWDAENAPQNVGMSHNVLARTKTAGDETVVEAITKVQSIDLVADPATTTGLYEHLESIDETADGRPGATTVAMPATWADVTLADLRRFRPELICEVEQSTESELRRELDELHAKEAAVERRELIARLLTEHNLPLPMAGDQAAARIVSEAFLHELMQAPAEKLRLLVEERAALVRSAFRWPANRSTPHRGPKSKDQATAHGGASQGRPSTAAEFATAVRGR